MAASTSSTMYRTLTRSAVSSDITVLLSYGSIKPLCPIRVGTAAPDRPNRGVYVESDDMPTSVFPRLEPRLPEVSKPIQYVGGELNSTTKDWDSVDVRWALMYPDAYEVGLPNQGVMILYEVLNEQGWILAERTY